MTNNMTNEFAHKVARQIELYGWHCEVKDVRKTNGICTGIVIRKNEDDRVGATVYVPDSIADLTWDDLSDDDVRDAASEYIAAVANTPMPSEDTGDKIQNILNDKKEVLDRTVFALVNRKWNNDPCLVTSPVDGDLQYIYKVDVSDIVGEGGTLRLTKDHLLMSGLTEEEVFETAYKNTQDKSPAKIMDIKDIIPEVDNLPEGMVYVVTNEHMTFGAAAITYPEVVAKVARLLGDGFAIIPSSVHEVICYNRLDVTAAQMAQMIKEVNRMYVDTREWLSDHIYKVDDNGELVSVISDMEVVA